MCGQVLHDKSNFTLNTTEDSDDEVIYDNPIDLVGDQGSLP